MSVQRSYSIHFRNSTKAKTFLTNWPFKSLYGGVFLSGAEAKHYGDIFRSQGLSFPVEGVAGAKEYLAGNVERAREVGNTLDVHAALLPLALLSGVIEDEAASVGRAVVDVSRVTKSAAARHRSLRNLCDCILVIVGSLAEWTQASRPILQSEDAAQFHGDPGTDGDQEEGGRNPKTRCRSSKDLVQTWTRTAHLLFWGWRCDVLRYLDEDRHSDVAVVKNRVRRWIEQISSTSRMGLRLPMLRWHDHGRTIADGKGAFLDAVASVRRRLSSLSAWLHCLDLSLAWDAARVCDRVHARHLEKQRRSGGPVPHGGWNLLNFQLSGTGHGQAREGAAPLPTAAGLLQLQRGWLDDIVADAHVRDMEAARKNDHKRKSRRRRKPPAASTAAAVEAAMASGVRYVPAPAAPDSSRVAEGVDVRQAVVATLREDVVPEALAHELTLMKYAAENRLDKSLHDSLSNLLTSVLTPNPFPVLTDALAVSSMSIVLRRTVDSDPGRSPPAALKPVGRGGDDEGKKVFVARGAQKDGKVYGSKPALTDVDVHAALSIFGVLPPVAGWALDALGDNCADVQVGIFGCARRHGSFVHHAVPSDLTVMLVCECDFDLDSGTTPVEHFARCAVRCTTAAHEKSALLVIGLAARTGLEDDPASPGEDTTGGDRFPLAQVLHEPEEVEDELAHLGPEAIVIEALVPYPTPGGGEALVPISIRLLLVTESSASGDGGGYSEASAASMFYDCVFSTAAAAESVAARFAALAEESDLPRGHVKRARQRVSESVDKGGYLEVYQRVHCLRCLRSAVPVDDVESAPQTPESEADSSKGAPEAASHTREWEAPHTSRAFGAEGDAGATVALKRMAKGPAGRLYHARRLLGVLHKVILKESLAPEMLELLDGTTIRQHAEYCIPYLLDTLAEQPVVRFEGAVQSIKLRARLLLDRVTKMTEVEDLSETVQTQAAAMAATQESACDLAGATISMLEIVQLAVESDTHMCCCPEMDSVLEQLRGVERTGQKPHRVVRRGGRRVVAAARVGSSR